MNMMMTIMTDVFLAFTVDDRDGEGGRSGDEGEEDFRAGCDSLTLNS
jgi:hypothetical protein